MLTLDAELQEIAERGLDEALAQMKAEGGDVVFLDPNTGSCWPWLPASADAGGVPRASTFTDPFEPGSTAKLFTAAALCSHHRVDSTDEVFAEGGHLVHAGDQQRADPPHHRRARDAPAT